MCLSTVYKNNRSEDSLLMKNVMRLECRGDKVILTDLMDRQMELTGELQEANLVEGFVIVREALPA